MAEDASKLREQIALLSSLINKHKQKVSPKIPGITSLKSNLQRHPIQAPKQRIATPSLSSLKWIKPPVAANVQVSSMPEHQRPLLVQAKPKTAELQAKGLTLGSQPRANSNTYVLNKKRGNHFTSSVKSVPNRTALRWRKPGVPSGQNTQSHSDSELYTNRTRKVTSASSSASASEVPVQGNFPRQAQVPAVHAAPYKWEKSQLTNSRTSLVQRRTKLDKGSRSSVSRTKWRTASRSTTVDNPYVLRKQTSKTHSKAVVTRSRLSKGSSCGLPSKNRHVWRSKNLLKLDRRERLPGALSVERRKSIDSFIQRRRKVVQQETLSTKPLVSRFSVIRSKQSSPIKAEKSSKVVFIGGVAYKSSANKLSKAVDRKPPLVRRSSHKGTTVRVGRDSTMVKINGEKFVMDGTGKTLTRVKKARSVREVPVIPMLSEDLSKRTERRRSSNKVVIGGATFLQTAPGTLVRANPLTTQTLASRVLRRSVKTARVLKRKDKQKYCMFYNRFGKCNKGDKCTFIHDPSKVAVCTKFLRGTCKNTDGSCPFSHKIDPDKMPVCQFFLRGTCTNDNCPYSHVNVSKTAQVCEDFVAGFCPRGQKCKKKHTLECDEFKATGTCSKGSRCRLVHRKRKERKTERKSSVASSEREEKRLRLDMSEHEGFLPLSRADVNEEANPKGPTSDSQAQTTVEPLTIRPRFLKVKDV